MPRRPPAQVVQFSNVSSTLIALAGHVFGTRTLRSVSALHALRNCPRRSRETSDRHRRQRLGRLCLESARTPDERQLNLFSAHTTRRRTRSAPDCTLCARELLNARFGTDTSWRKPDGYPPSSTFTRCRPCLLDRLGRDIGHTSRKSFDTNSFARSRNRGNRLDCSVWRNKSATSVQRSNRILPRLTEPKPTPLHPSASESVRRVLLLRRMQLVTHDATIFWSSADNVANPGAASDPANPALASCFHGRHRTNHAFMGARARRGIRKLRFDRSSRRAVTTPGATDQWRFRSRATELPARGFDPSGKRRSGSTTGHDRRSVHALAMTASSSTTDSESK